MYGYSARAPRRYSSPGGARAVYSAGGQQAGAIKQIGGATIHPDSVAYLAAAYKAKAGGDSSKLAALWGGNIVQDKAWAKANGLVWSVKANRWVYPDEKIESPTGVHRQYLGGDKWQDVVWSDAANGWVPVSGNAAPQAQPQKAAPSPQPPPPAPQQAAPAPQQQHAQPSAQPQAPAPKQKAALAPQQAAAQQGAAAPVPPSAYAGWKASQKHKGG